MARAQSDDGFFLLFFFPGYCRGSLRLFKWLSRFSRCTAQTLLDIYDLSVLCMRVRGKMNILTRDKVIDDMPMFALIINRFWVIKAIHFKTTSYTYTDTNILQAIAIERKPILRVLQGSSSSTYFRRLPYNTCERQSHSLGSAYTCLPNTRAECIIEWMRCGSLFEIINKPRLQRTKHSSPEYRFSSSSSLLHHHCRM